MKDRINVSIKYREEFRPFCPSVLFERQAEYFGDTFDAPFMVVSFPVKERGKQKIPARYEFARYRRRERQPFLGSYRLSKSN
jgi:predicted NodU family carbamoyl transferase